ncbi:MAG: DapH/DapD/GlmU-related protein, partial [Alphaproteobacteria bacterium]
KDASPAQLESRLCNSGVMAIDGRRLPGWLARIGDKNAKREFYLTDIVAFARADGRACRHILCDESEVLGVNDRVELARAERIAQERLRRRAMANGATLIDPATVYFSFDTELGQDVVVEPGVRFGPGVRVGNGVEIRAYCHIEGAIVGERAIVGPFARLRPGAALAQEAHVGNFVEVKNTSLGKGAKANHLTYLGDATVGAEANIGAGTITCNYDGYLKHPTEIGAGAFIGSNTALVAPVRVGAGAVVGAGSTITQDVPADALAVERNEQRTVASGGRLLRERKSAEKAARQAAKSKPGKD